MERRGRRFVVDRALGGVWGASSSCYRVIPIGLDTTLQIHAEFPTNVSEVYREVPA
jgi:hypothetical protein